MSKKGWISLLLCISCITAGMLHYEIDPKREATLYSPSQIDSLIAQTTYDFSLSSDQISTQTIQHDSLFSRKNYKIRVNPGFSKTTFHHHLNRRLSPLDVSIYGLVQFPERDLQLNVLYNNTIHRTIELTSDVEITTQNLIIPKLPE